MSHAPIRPDELRPGDVIELSGIKATIRRVEVHSDFATGEPMYWIIRESVGREERRRYPDGRAEASLRPDDLVHVVSTMDGHK